MHWTIYALLSALFAGAVGILGKIGLKGIDTTLATSIRSIVMMLFLVIVSVSLGKFSNLSSIDNKTYLFIFASGIAGALSWLFYFYALKLGPATGVSAIDRTSVLFVLILAVLFLGEKLTLYKGLGAILIACGAILMSI